MTFKVVNIIAKCSPGTESGTVGYWPEADVQKLTINVCSSGEADMTRTPRNVGS
jgi:hypothetical protein